MILGNKIVAPTYQRAYAWETPIEKSQRKTHTDVLLTDLDEYQKIMPEHHIILGTFYLRKNQIQSFMSLMNSRG